MRGKISSSGELRNYGFIEVEGKEKDVFVHVTNVNGEVILGEGDMVEFEVEEGKKGLNAINVRKVEGGKG